MRNDKDMKVAARHIINRLEKWNRSLRCKWELFDTGLRVGLHCRHLCGPQHIRIEMFTSGSLTHSAISRHSQLCPTVRAETIRPTASHNSLD